MFCTFAPVVLVLPEIGICRCNITIDIIFLSINFSTFYEEIIIPVDPRCYSDVDVCRSGGPERGAEKSAEFFNEWQLSWQNDVAGSH